MAVFEQMSVYENIDYFCGLYIKDKQKRKELVEEAITFTGLSDFRKMRPKKLSGGLLRRLNIACGIVHKPRLIIMDEPTVAVDPQSRNKIPDEHGFVIELDVFHGEYEGLVMAEVEFPSEEVAVEYEGPEWFDDEVTFDSRYQNNNLANK